MAFKTSPHRAAQSAVLARTVAGGSATATVVTVVRNPSPRLRCFLSIGWEGDSTDNASIATSTYTITALRWNPITGRRARLHALVAGRALPDAVELDSAVDAVEISCALAAVNANGNIVLLTTWEAPPDTPDLDALFAGCSLDAPAPVTLS